MLQTSSAAQSHEEHLAILSAVEDGDPERVAAATELHPAHRLQRS
jgi:DNA-binding GntR family transcriptional regulator